MSNRFISFDTETTGLSVTKGHRIVEIGCIEIEDLIPTKNVFHCYLNPQRKVSESALKVHGYTDEFLSDKNIFKDIADDFLKFIEGKKIVIHNAEFDTNFKLIPPLRSESDLNSLKEGLVDGTLDYLTSMHEPFDIDNKKIVFDNASSGSIGLESMFGLMSNQFTLEKTIDILTRKKIIFGVDDHPLEIGSLADISLFNPDKSP